VAVEAVAAVEAAAAVEVAAAVEAAVEVAAVVEAAVEAAAVVEAVLKKVIKYSNNVYCFKITSSFLYIECCYCTLLLYKLDC
jgi:hypothetical protein